MLNTWNPGINQDQPLPPLMWPKAPAAKLLKLWKGADASVGIMGFLLKGGGGIFLLQRDGLLGKKIFKMYPLHGTNPYPSKFGKFGKLIDSKVPAWLDPGICDRSQGLVTHPRSSTWQDTSPQQLHEKQYHLRITWKHKLRGFQSCSWLVMLIHSGLQGSCHHHLYRRLASKTHLEENWKNLTNPDKPQSHLKRGDFRLVNYYFSEN